MRPPERFRTARDDVERPRVPDPLRDFVADRRDTFLFALPRERARTLRCLAVDFFLGRRLRDVFEIALELFVTLRTVCLAMGPSLLGGFSGPRSVTWPFAVILRH